MTGFAAARTPREFSEARLALLSAGTPDEVHRAWLGRAVLPPPERAWIDEVYSGLLRVGPDPARFVARRISGAVVAYDVAREDEAPPRDLLIVLADKGHSLTVRPYEFLQALPRDRYDVLVITDSAERTYLQGVEGLGDDHPQVIGALRRLADGRRTVVVGVCLGGAPAFSIAREIGAHRALSIGGSGTRRVAATAGAGPARTDDVATAPALAAVFGAGFGVDADRALELRALFGDVRLIAVDGVEDHRVLTRAAEAGVLADLLGRLLDLDRPLPAARGLAVVTEDPLPAPDAPTYRRRMSDHAAQVTAAADLVLNVPTADRPSASSPRPSRSRVAIQRWTRRGVGRVVRGLPMPQRARRAAQVHLYRRLGLAIDVEPRRRRR